MAELPYEIWLMIVEYLPAHHIRRLYSVNRALFNIALDLRCKDASLGILPDRVVEETYPPILRNPLLSSRPTSLQITFHNSSNQPGPDVKETPVRNRWKPVLRTVMGNTKAKYATATVKLGQIASYVMPRWTRISTLSCVFAKMSEVQMALGNAEASVIFPELLKMTSSRLRHLHIQSPLAMHLPQHLGPLESFSVHCCDPYHKWHTHNVILDKISAFLLAHQSTIRAVSFSIDRPGLNIQPFLQCLQDMSCLHTIELSLSYGTISTGTTLNFGNLRQVLEKHQKYVRKLSLSFVVDRVIGWAVLPFFRHDWCSVRLPDLRDLTIRTPGIPFRQELGTYIRLFSSSLVSLKMENVSFSAHIGDSILKRFCVMLGEFPCLQHLGMHLSNFNIEQLFVFAAALPHLHSLLLHYSYQSLLVTSSVNTRRQLSPQSFATWELQSFDYKTPDLENNDWIDEQVARYLPNVLWVRKKRRDECLRRAV